METKEAILSTINEMKDFTQSNQHNLEQIDSQNSPDTNNESDSKPNIFIDIKEEVDLLEDGTISDEVALLLQLKEKSLVLFEGLRATQNKDIEIKLEMVISYLEYQLYVIEDRLKSLETNQNT